MMPSSSRLRRAAKEPPPRRCPLCEATVPVGARKCSFCGSILDYDSDQEQHTPPLGRAATPSDDRLMAFAIIMALVGALAFWGCVWRLSALQPRSAIFWAIYFVSGLVAGIAIARDARRVRIQHTPYGTPRWWMGLTLLVLPAGLAGYAAARTHAGARDLTRWAMATAALWALSAIVVGWTVTHGPPQTPPPELSEIAQQILIPVSAGGTTDTLERAVMMPGSPTP